MRRAGWAAAATAFAALLLWAGGAREPAPDRKVVPEAAAKLVATTPVPSSPPLPPAPVATVVRPDDPSLHGLTITARFDGARLRWTGIVDLPDRAILTVYLRTHPMVLLHRRGGSRLYWSTEQADQSETCEVAKRRLAGEMPVGGPGFYLLEFHYSRFSQRHVEVLKALGPQYQNWSQSVPVLAGDAHEFAQRLSADSGAARGLVARLRHALARMQAEIVLEPKHQNWRPILQVLESIERDTEEYPLLCVATGRVILEACARIAACHPGLPRLDFAVGSPEANRAAIGRSDIPPGVNLEWDIDLAWAYVHRASECLPRERLLLPFLIASECWESRSLWPVARDMGLANAASFANEDMDMRQSCERMRLVIHRMDLATRAGDEARDEARDERDRLVRELSLIPEP